MKAIYLFTIILLGLAAYACGNDEATAQYDSETCEALAVKVERREAISQEEYCEMIGQNEAILRYLIEKSREIAEEPSENRNDSWRTLLADPEYMERFSYMFTLGSALYQADADGKLDEANKKRYDALDKYNRELAEYSERN